MQPSANVQIDPSRLNAPATQAPPAWSEARWIDTGEREPSLLAELGIPLRCFRTDRGYFVACFLPERGWYWASALSDVPPERWALPLQHRSRRTLAF